MEFRVYVRAIVLNSDGHLLMLQKNSDQKIAPDRWLLPGGAVEFGETAENALKRELQEETGLVVESSKLLGDDFRVIQSTHWQGLIYLVVGDCKSVFNREPEKHAALEWREIQFAKTVLSSNEWKALASKL